MKKMFTSYWRKHYTAPIEAERSWSVVHCVRGAALTALAWMTTVDLPTVAALFLFEGAKDFFVQRYIQTIRNDFRGNNPRSFIRFLRYYCRRLISNFMFASMTLIIAWKGAFFTWPSISHMLTSRIGNSSHFLLGFVETELIAIGVLTRRQVSHVAGSFATLGSFVASIDLAGVTLMGIRPFWINIGISVMLLVYYGFCTLRFYYPHLFPAVEPEELGTELTSSLAE